MKEFKVTPIRNGTVIDHIECGMALKVLRIIGLDGENVQSPVSVLMHVPSKKSGWKDVLKVEDRELDPKDVDKIALIAPKATINIIRDFNVAEKHNRAAGRRGPGQGSLQQPQLHHQSEGAGGTGVQRRIEEPSSAALHLLRPHTGQHR